MSVDLIRYAGDALAADPALVAALGSASRITQGYPDKVSAVPCLALLRANQRDSVAADDSVLAEEVLLTVHTFTAGDVDTQSITDHVDRVLRAKRLYVDFSEDVPEPDDHFRHRVSRYRGLLSADDLD